ncbi:MAG: hypothetical protein WC444_04165 [Candidatus Paceibacterota bacterium]
MRLAISIEVGPDDGNEEETVLESKNIISSLLPHSNKYVVKAALVRDGDRSQGNLLYPKLEGRFGQHYRNKKVDIREILKKE